MSGSTTSEAEKMEELLTAENAAADQQGPSETEETKRDELPHDKAIGNGSEERKLQGTEGTAVVQDSNANSVDDGVSENVQDERKVEDVPDQGIMEAKTGAAKIESGDVIEAGEDKPAEIKKENGEKPEEEGQGGTAEIQENLKDEKDLAEKEEAVDESSKAAEKTELNIEQNQEGIKQVEEERKTIKEEEEMKRIEEERRVEEERQKAEEEERKKVEEEERKRAEEEERKKAEEERKRAEEERKRAEEEKNKVEEEERKSAVGASEMKHRNVPSKVTTPEEDIEEDTKKVPRAPSNGYSPMKGILFITGVALIIVGLIQLIKTSSDDLPSSEPSPSSELGHCSLRKRLDRENVLAKETESLRKKYPTIDWYTVAGTSWTHIQEQQPIQRPVVLLLAGQSGTTTINDVGTDIANMYANVYFGKRKKRQILQISGSASDLEGISASKVKEEMDTQIKTGFQGCARVALIKDFDKLPPCSAILFHGYCDNDSAPFKDVVFIFTMTLRENIPEGAEKLDAERIVQEQLQEQWGQCSQEFPPDKITSMHARVANNIVIVP